jgi:cell division protein FtsI (penicillin-binding protein 3)
MSEKRDIQVRSMLIFMAVLVVSVFIVGKVIAIQYASSPEFAAEAEVQATRTMTIKPVRGTIYSSDGQVLATSDPRYEIRMDVKTVDEEVFNEGVDSLSYELAMLFRDRSKKEYYQLLTSARRKGSRYQLIQRNVSGRDYKLLKKLPIFRKGQYKGGLIALKTEKRKRPYGILAARTIGMEREGVRPVGLEGAFSKELSGVEGLQLMRREGARWIPVSDKYEREPQNGLDMYTTIDVRLQDVAESELLRQLKDQGAAHGCVILMEVKTGYIKAISNLSRNDDGSYSESYNHAVGRSTEPGSTFKLASLMVAIEDGKIGLDDSISTNNGTYKFYDRTMRDSREGGYGVVTVREGFAYSSNVAVSRLIHKHYSNEPQRFVKGLRKLGLDRATGIAIAGEEKPYLRDAGDAGWSGISLPWMSIGYEVRLTPLQILAFYNAVANNGVMMKPQLVSTLRNGREVEQSFEPVVINPRICSQRTLKAARELLEAVVEFGTGKKLQAASFRIAGKTGTTQIAQDGGGYGKGSVVRHQASFVGYFPADEPMYSCIVVIAAPTKAIYGADVSGTVFKAIADKVYSGSLRHHQAINENDVARTGIPRIKKGYASEIEELLEELGIPAGPVSGEGDWAVVSSEDNKAVLKMQEMPSGKMPDVKGMSARDALFLLENMGVLVNIQGAGKVTRQSVKAGTAIRQDMLVELTLE